MSDNLVAREQLKSVVERIERLEEEKKAIADDIRDVYAEAKANGFNAKVLREVIKLRKMDKTERDELDAVRDLYLQALGMLPEFEPASSAEDNQEDSNEGGVEDVVCTDDIYDQAVAIVVRDRKASTSYIQRKLSIGYNRAAKILERMEQLGLISPANHVGKREITFPEGFEASQ